MVDWGSFRRFLSSLGTRWVPMPFSFFSSSCSPNAEEFVHHLLLQFLLFFLRRWNQQKMVTQSRFFPTEKKIVCGFCSLKLKNHERRFPGRTKIADFRKNEMPKNWSTDNSIVQLHAYEIFLNPYTSTSWGLNRCRYFWFAALFQLLSKTTWAILACFFLPWTTLN